MAKLIRILIFGLLFGVFVHSDNSQMCNTAEEDSSMCEKVQAPGTAEHLFQILYEPLIRNLTEISEDSKKSITDFFLYTLSHCDFDSTNDTTIAKSFKFILFKPNLVEPEYIDGNDLLNGCDALKSGSGLTNKTIWLWPGYADNSSFGNSKEFIYLWQMDQAPRLAKQANAQVIAIDWGSTKLSICSYPMLVYCYMDTISEWMAKVIETCSTIAPSTSISNTWLIGHSLGAQFVGYTAIALQTPTTKVEKVIGLDSAGPLFEPAQILGHNLTGKCQGIQRDYADDTYVFMTRRSHFGPKNSNLAAVNVYVNEKKNFCQSGCNSALDIGCNHGYASGWLLKALADNETILGTILTNANKDPIYDVTIYGKMQPGIYGIESDDNPPLQVVIPEKRTTT